MRTFDHPPIASYQLYLAVLPSRPPQFKKKKFTHPNSKLITMGFNQ